MRTFVILSAWLWGLVALCGVTDAAVDFGSWIFLFLSAPVIGLLWLGYSAAVPEVFGTPRVRWWWLSVPMIGVGCLGLYWDHHGLAARVWLCESALREHAEWVRQNPEAKSEQQRIGLFQVRFASADGERIYLHTASAFIDTSGVVYCLDGTPPDSSEVGQRWSHAYRHLYGPWWWFRISD